MTLLRNLRRQAKRQADFNAANDRHTRGFIEPELAARMTKPKVADAAHQVFVDVPGENGSRPCSPKFFGDHGQEAASRFLEAINANICLGRLKGWGNARIETAIHIPAH